MNEQASISMPVAPGIARLASLLAAHTPGDGSFALPVSGLYAIRASRPSAELVHDLQKASLCIVAQGAKTVLLGSEAYDYDASRMLIFSVDLPVSAQVTQASPSSPYLCFRLDLDPQQVAAVLMKVYPDGAPPVREGRAVYLAQAGEAIVDAAARLLALAADPTDASLLAPLAVEEILVRLLRSPVGGRVAQIGRVDSNLQRIARALAWMRDNYAQPMRVEDLAERASMSPSTLHQHFKSLTSMSPLQFQKVLRLQEARRLMAGGLAASTAGNRVGYVSASQFSREYARLFGKAPSRDVGMRKAMPQ